MDFKYYFSFVYNVLKHFFLLTEWTIEIFLNTLGKISDNKKVNISYHFYIILYSV